MGQWTKLILETGPLVVFFAVNTWTGDLILATGVFVVTTIVAIGISWAMVRKLPVMPLVGGFFVVVFGGLTVLLDDELFIKVKPTIVNMLFATILTVGIVTGRNFLRMAMESALALTDTGWRIMTIRWAVFFVFLAILNEIVWRNFDSDTWVAFKVWGIMPLTLIFSFAQVPLILKHQIHDEEDDEDEEEEEDEEEQDGTTVAAAKDQQPTTAPLPDRQAS